MPSTERLYKIETLIRHRGSVSFAELLQVLEVSPATLKRDLEYLRSRLGAPIVYDRFSNGYRFGDEGSGPAAAAPDANRPHALATAAATTAANAAPGSVTGRAAASASATGLGRAAVPPGGGAGRDAGTRHELPGLWFNERELYALLMAQQLLAGVDTRGLLGRHLQPLIDRLQGMLGPDGDQRGAQLVRRVRIIGALNRPVAGEIFARATDGLIRRRRLVMRYHSRGRGQVGEREVSPQRLTHYRGTWYLDAWCHQRERLLRFALDAVQSVRVAEARARDLPLKQVAAEMDAGYGIYAGGTPQRAVLAFSARAAAWVSHEQWHPEQQGRWLPDGRWELTLPYMDETELVMDLLRQGEQVQVLAPASLRTSVRKRLQAALAQYGE